MPTSRGSSTPGTTSSPSELDVLRALAAPDVPVWHEEPLAALVAERLGAKRPLVRPLVERLDVRLDLPGALFGKLDETWLFALDEAAPPLADALAGVEGVMARERAGDHAIVRTFAQDAIERERRLRALHQRLGSRPLAQLHRPRPPPPRRKLTRADWALLSAMQRQPWAPLDALAEAAGASSRVAKERVPKLVADGLAALEALPREAPLSFALVRVSPSSTAAARHALDAFAPATLRAWVPDAGEAARADALLYGAPEAHADARERARDVPGVAAVEVLPRAEAWRDEPAWDALVKAAFAAAPP